MYRGRLLALAEQSLGSSLLSITSQGSLKAQEMLYTGIQEKGKDTAGSSVLRLLGNRAGHVLRQVDQRLATPEPSLPVSCQEREGASLMRYREDQNGMSSAVCGSLCSSLFAGVATGVGASADAEVDAAGAAVGCGALGVRTGGGGGLLITCHFTRSRVATESSKDE